MILPSNSFLNKRWSYLPHRCVHRKMNEAEIKNMMNPFYSGSITSNTIMPIFSPPMQEKSFDKFRQTRGNGPNAIKPAETGDSSPAQKVCRRCKKRAHQGAPLRVVSGHIGPILLVFALEIQTQENRPNVHQSTVLTIFSTSFCFIRCIILKALLT